MSELISPRRRVNRTIDRGNAMITAKIAATTSGKPVLWNVSREGGHDSLLYGGPDAFADALAFFLWQLGDPSFQPE